VVAIHKNLLLGIRVGDFPLAIANPDVGVGNVAKNRAALVALALSRLSILLAGSLAITLLIVVLLVLGLDVENLAQLCEILDDSCHRKILLVL
jgi:hypothetical protein